MAHKYWVLILVMCQALGLTIYFCWLQTTAFPLDIYFPIPWIFHISCSDFSHILSPLTHNWECVLYIDKKTEAIGSKIPLSFQVSPHILPSWYLLWMTCLFIFQSNSDHCTYALDSVTFCFQGFASVIIFWFNSFCDFFSTLSFHSFKNHGVISLNIETKTSRDYFLSRLYYISLIPFGAKLMKGESNPYSFILSWNHINQAFIATPQKPSKVTHVLCVTKKAHYQFSYSTFPLHLTQWVTLWSSLFRWLL